MINTIKLDGKIRERSSKTMFTGDHSEIEIQCFECGDWKEIKKIKSEHIIKKFLCGKCGRKSKKKVSKKKVTKKKVAKKSKPSWALDCPHRPFFKCKAPRECQGCYYHPIRKVALQAKYGMPFEKGEGKNPKDHWFYYSKKYSKQLLGMLDDIKNGKGLMPGGRRYYFRYARKEDE